MLIQNKALVVKVSNLKVSILLFQTRLTGRVEDLRVVVIDREGSVTLKISNIVSPTQSYVRPVVHKTIVYTD